jgi:homoserine/homoserine lactone efflux protein
MVAVDLIVMGCYTALSVRLLTWLRTPRQQTMLNRVFSGLFATAALVLALVRRGPATA